MTIIDIYKIAFNILLSYWWIAAPIVLFLILKRLWLNHKRTEFIKDLKWVVLEIRIPRNVVKTPKAMEQFFSGLHVSKKDPDFKEKYFKGMIPTWHSVEIVGKGGNIHFYVRTQEKFRNLVESQIYAQYPQAEISEVPDYMPEMPKGIPNKDYDSLVSELILTKPDAYPIRTYPYFFEEREAEERTDPIAGLFEFLNTLNPGENVWIHILINPTGDEWKEEGEKEVSKILGKEVKKSKKGGLIMQETHGWASAIGDGIKELFFGPSSSSKEAESVQEAKEYLTPGQKEVVSAIEKNISKLGYKTVIRFTYWAPKDIFSKDRISSVAGFFAQFNTQNLNGFKPSKAITTKFKLFKKRREASQQRYLTSMFRKRKFPFSKISTRGFVLNTEELATIFHIPTKQVELEKVGKLEAKKSGPPPELPTE
ncbi:MAG: hypothetical protein GF387_03385 [Candidatus Portnoybacteria bacterium]|nr:hypothetical protein [Candidatus Portnoybacteria bacterium]